MTTATHQNDANTIKTYRVEDIARILGITV